MNVMWERQGEQDGDLLYSLEGEMSFWKHYNIQYQTGIPTTYLLNKVTPHNIKSESLDKIILQ
jgi:hypothetical protein